MHNDIKNENILPKNKYWKQKQINLKFPLPYYYNNKYSIFLYKPDSSYISTYPENFNNQKRKVKPSALLLRFFS